MHFFLTFTIKLFFKTHTFEFKFLNIHVKYFVILASLFIFNIFSHTFYSRFPGIPFAFLVPCFIYFSLTIFPHLFDLGVQTISSAFLYYYCYLFLLQIFPIGFVYYFVNYRISYYFLQIFSF